MVSARMADGRARRAGPVRDAAVRRHLQAWKNMDAASRCSWYTAKDSRVLRDSREPSAAILAAEVLSRSPRRRAICCARFHAAGRSLADRA